MLIRKGAKLVQFPEDVTGEYGIKNSKNITIEELEKRKKHEIDLSEIPEEYREIYKILKKPLSANEISIEIKADVTEVYSMLFLMELEGLIEKQGSKYIIKGEKS